ncbi:MAG: rubrerythrin family protein [Elusimicrobiota bacterium]|jgi:rubrerythrin|nr:rubrerythrin family protein [Elusimicrobiota bacterium]
MKNIQGSKTEKNLLKSFAGESQARTRYTFFASVAKKEGYEQISSIFTETADNEKEHAEVFFKYLKYGQPLEITATFPAGKIGVTEENLLAAAEGENEEWSKLYKEFGEIAKQEGFDDVAASFINISKVEKHHEERYRKLLENLKNGKVFEKTEIIKWKCRNCGYIHEGNSAPDACPSCKHPKAYFEILADNF